jgi:hypothetical protein
MLLSVLRVAAAALSSHDGQIDAACVPVPRGRWQLLCEADVCLSRTGRSADKARDDFQARSKMPSLGSADLQTSSRQTRADSPPTVLMVSMLLAADPT